MTGQQPDIVFFFWETSAMARQAATAVKKGQAGLIAVYATNMADQNHRATNRWLAPSDRDG